MTADEARMLGEQELFDLLERLVIETRGNLAEVARRIGRDRSTVRYHLRRFGMLGEPVGSKPKTPKKPKAGEPRPPLEPKAETRTLHPSE